MWPEGAGRQFEISPSTQMSWYSPSSCWRMPATRSRTVQMRRSWARAGGGVAGFAVRAARRRGLVWLGAASGVPVAWEDWRRLRAVERGFREEGAWAGPAAGDAKRRPICDWALGGLEMRDSADEGRPGCCPGADCGARAGLDLSQRLASVWGGEFSSPSAISQESRAFGVRCGPRAIDRRDSRDFSGRDDVPGYTQRRRGRADRGMDRRLGGDGAVRWRRHLPGRLRGGGRGQVARAREQARRVAPGRGGTRGGGGRSIR